MDSLTLVILTCLPKTNRQRHSDQASRMLQPVLQRPLNKLHGTVLMPDGQLQAHHAADDPFLFFFTQQTALFGHVNHVSHINVHCLTMQQRWENFLYEKEKSEVM